QLALVDGEVDIAQRRCVGAVVGDAHVLEPDHRDATAGSTGRVRSGFRWVAGGTVTTGGAASAASRPRAQPTTAAAGSWGHSDTYGEGLRAISSPTTTNT